MTRLTYAVKDAEGYCVGEGIEERAEWTKAQIAAHISARTTPAVTVIDLDVRGATRPPRRPDPLSAKRARLDALRAIGWDQRTDQETLELDGLARDLGR